MQRPKLRDNQGKKPYELYPLGQFPDNVIYSIAKWITYNFAIGRNDINGEDWGDIFAKAIEGEHLDKPIGLADVIYEGMAWSVKSVKNDKPFNAINVRLISGRNSLNYSFDVKNPFDNVQQTGSMVLSIWNERVSIAKKSYEPLRTCVLIRNFNALEFVLFEEETVRFNELDFEWRVNKRDNFEGYERATGKHMFTWQPHGSQFTIIYPIPPSAKKFQVKRPGMLDFEKIIENIGFEDSWVTFM